MRCKECGAVFKPMRFLQKFCGQSDACLSAEAAFALQKTKAIKSREWAREKKVRKEAIMSHSEWLNELQKVFNAFIRERDKGKPCISCGTYKGQMQAGHFRSVGSAPHIRFNEMNVHGQCSTCNNHLHGNLIEYRKRLIERIGADNVQYIEQFNDSSKLTVPEIKELMAYYRGLTKELKKQVA